jgi:hypothetical protein
MARSQGWTVVMALVVGILGASIFWFYGPFLQRQVARQVAEAMKTQPLTADLAKGGGAALTGAGSQAMGPRFQLLGDGKQVFLADLKEGRTWRYYHYTKEGGYAKEEEGFLPIPLYYGGKKFYSADEVEPTPAKGEAPQAKPGEKKP